MGHRGGCRSPARVRAASAENRDGPLASSPAMLRRPHLSLPFLVSPIIRRVAWHVRRVGGQLDRRFFLALTRGIVGVVLISAVLITIVEKPWTFESVFDSFNWGIATVLGQGDSGFVTSPAGRAIGWLLILFGVAM